MLPNRKSVLFRIVSSRPIFLFIHVLSLTKIVSVVNSVIIIFAYFSTVLENGIKSFFTFFCHRVSRVHRVKGNHGYFKLRGVLHRSLIHIMFHVNKRQSYRSLILLSAATNLTSFGACFLSVAAQMIIYLFSSSHQSETDDWD